MAPIPLSQTPQRIGVVRVITRLNVGGPAIQAMLLTRHLDPERYRSTLIAGTAAPREGDMRLLRHDSVPVRVIPSLRREISGMEDLRALIALVKVLRVEKPQIVHTHMAKAGALGRIAARIAGVPIVLHTYHGNVLRGYFSRPLTHGFALIERALARISTRVVAISPRQRRELVALGIAQPDRIVDVPLGLDLRPFLEARSGMVRAELRLPADTELVGIVARLVPIKSVDTFIDAARLVAADRPRTRFVIVGDGEMRHSLEDAVLRSPLFDRVHFLGWRADVPEIYKDLDVVVLSSRNEGTPLSLIEALAASRPVVATAVGGVPDLLGASERGVLVPPDDPVSLAGAIRGLLSDRAMAERLASRGHEYVYPAFDASVLVARIDRLYVGLCAEASRT